MQVTWGCSNIIPNNSTINIKLHKFQDLLHKLQIKKSL